MMSALHPDTVDTAFRTAVQDFKNEIGDEILFKELLKSPSIDHVYDATKALQKEQAKQGHLRHLSKIEPFLFAMKEYTGVIEVMMQAKPDVVPLVWGPIKLLLERACVLKESFDAIVNVIADIGTKLPRFQRVAEMFRHNGCFNEILVLFFKDILEIYAITLKFFNLSRWKFVFESLWPRHRDKIKLVVTHLESHTLLLRDEVNTEHIRQAYLARAAALKHYEQAEKDHRRQEFDSIRTAVAPPHFGENLHRLRGRMYQGTGQWLTRHPTFQKWLNKEVTSARVLWLNGIPGAGKSVLSCTAVGASRTTGLTAFAFLSHDQTGSMTALAILHSLIFQLASQDVLMQEVVCRSYTEAFRDDIEMVSVLLGKVIDYSGLAFVIVDGLDEIDGRECLLLLSSLLEVSNGSDGARLLFSSRAENAIKRRLRGVASLRVDKYNYESIETYISGQSERWLEEREYSHEEEEEIRRLLMPLALKSKGMFLYASIIVQSLEMMDDIDEIRENMAVLPEKLDDIYRRVLHRVNSIEPQASRVKAQKILGWVACSPKLTVQELGQALAISTDETGGHRRTNVNPLNMIKICGPVIEVVDEHVYIVHFTFREYLLSPTISGSINEKDAVLSLALSCLIYLCQDHYDLVVSDEKLVSDILIGVYRLHFFCTSSWLDLVAKYLQLNGDQKPDTALIESLKRLKEARSSKVLEDVSTVSRPVALRQIKFVDSDLHDWLCRVVQSQFKQRELNVLAMKDYSAQCDPTTLSASAARVYRTLDQLLCKTDEHTDCRCAELQRHYSQSSYRCPILGCKSHRNGFESRSLLHSHMRAHDQPWTCLTPGCKYKIGGFLSRSMRDQHQRLYHSQNEESNKNLQVTETQLVVAPLSPEDSERLLYDLISANRGSEVRMLLNHLRNDGTLRDVILDHGRLVPTAASTEVFAEVISAAEFYISYNPGDDYSSNFSDEEAATTQRLISSLGSLYTEYTASVPHKTAFQVKFWIDSLIVEEVRRSPLITPNSSIRETLAEADEWNQTFNGLKTSGALLLNFTELLRLSVFNRNVSAFKYLIHHNQAKVRGLRGIDNEVLQEIMASDLKDFRDEISLLIEGNMCMIRLGHMMDPNIWATQNILTAIEKDEGKKECLVSWWKTLGLFTHCTWDQLGRKFEYAAVEMLCKEVVQFFLALGIIQIDHDHTGMGAALGQLARKYTERTSEMMALLLSHGADPCAHTDDTIIFKSSAWQEIQRRTGISWEEHMLQVQSHPPHRSGDASAEYQRRLMMVRRCKEKIVENERALQDYQIQLMLLERQNRKRVEMAKADWRG